MRDKQVGQPLARVCGHVRRSLAAPLVALAALVMAGDSHASAQPLPDVEVDVISTRVYTAAVDAYADGREDEARARIARVVPSARRLLGGNPLIH